MSSQLIRYLASLAPACAAPVITVAFCELRMRMPTGNQPGCIAELFDSWQNLCQNLLHFANPNEPL